jgi:SAM-dependent methyltransferase
LPHPLHESTSWASYRRPAREPADPAGFAEAMRRPEYPRASAYDPTWIYCNLMGPNSLWLTEALTQQMPIETGMRVLDLGCGAAISSIFLAREFDAEVWAADLWVEPTQNAPRIAEAGLEGRVFPITAEAHTLPFAHAFFDAIVSIDSFHYYGTDVRYLSYLAQFLRPGGSIGIVVPGSAVDPDERSDEFLDRAPMGADYSTFRSAQWWARHWRRTSGITVTSAELLPGSHDLWHQHHRAGAAFDGTPFAETGDEALLQSEFGRDLGFVRVTAERLDETTLLFGPGRYATRIA